LRTFVRPIARQKRDQAKKSSFVKIKGNDVIATTKIFYSMVYVPALLVAYVVAFGLITRLVFGKPLGVAVRLAFAMAFVLPVYLYICVVFSYDFVRYVRNAWSQVKLKVLNQTSMTLSFKDLLREKLELEGEILVLIRTHREELREIVENQITRRNLNEEFTEEHIKKVLASLD
jgi:hypothetical protein